MLRLNDTIAAIATPTGEGGIGIVRVSGPSAFRIADLLWKPRPSSPRRSPKEQGKEIEKDPPPTPRPSAARTHTIHYGQIVDPANGEVIDDALLLVFRAPRSYTGEDVVEFSCHGGPVTLGRVLRLTMRHGARQAEPGEFTQRAFLSGRIDLAQAEAVCDLIRARTEAAQRLALRQSEGSVSREVAALKDDLVGALAAVEVTIDFSDEVGDLDYDDVLRRIRGIRERIEALIATAEQGRVYREGVRLAIVGRPNVGKSSILNALLRQERAIVTPIAGTTRDVIEETANIRGIPLIAIDTAGLRDTDDAVERIGVERAHAALESADAILFVLDGAAGWSDEDARIARRIAGRRAVWAVNKADLVPRGAAESLAHSLAREAGLAPVRPLSALTGEGVAQLEEALGTIILGAAAPESAAVVSNVRHVSALESARESLREAEATLGRHLPPDFVSIDLRGALDALGRVTGETAAEDVIHRIFQDFCIGK